MKILLINPVSLYSVKAPPLGLLYLASYLRSKINHIDIQILDANFLNMTTRMVVQYIQKTRPDLVGLYTITSNSRFAHDLIHAARPYVQYIVVGGPYATAYSNYLVNNKHIDFVIAGEGENLFYELVKNLSQKNSTRGTKPDYPAVNGNTCVKIEQNSASLVSDLNTLPFPAWDLLDTKKYFTLFKKTSQSAISFSKYSLPVITSRGCPFHCTYCHNIFGKQFRARSAENIVSEILFLVSEYGIKEVEIWDDVFNLDADRTFEFCDLIKKKGLNIRFSFSNGIRSDQATPELIDRLVDSGAYRINFAVETVTERLQKKIKKNLDLTHAKKIIEYTASKNIITGGFFMIGFPTETLEEMKATIQYAVTGPFDIASMLITTIYPGTALFHELTEEQQDELLRVEPDLFDYNNVSFNLSKVSDAVLMKLSKQAYVRFYFNFKRMFRLIKKVRFSDLVSNFWIISSIFFDKKTRLFFKKKP